MGKLAAISANSQTPEALRGGRDVDRGNRRPPSSAARVEARLTTVGKTQAKDVGAEATTHLEGEPKMRPTPSNTRRPRQLLPPLLTADSQRTVCVARAHKHARPTKTTPNTLTFEICYGDVQPRHNTSPHPLGNPPQKRKVTKTGTQTTHVQQSFCIRTGHPRWAETMQEQQRVRAEFQERTFANPLREHSRNKLRTLGTVPAETGTLPGPATESWIDSVQPDAFSSAAVPNVACEQRFKTPVFVCCAPLSGRYMAQITSDTPTGGPVCTHRMRPPFNPDSG